MVVIQRTVVSSLNLKCKYDLKTAFGSLRMIQVRSNMNFYREQEAADEDRVVVVHTHFILSK